MDPLAQYRPPPAPQPASRSGGGLFDPPSPRPLVPTREYREHEHRRDVARVTDAAVGADGELSAAKAAAVELLRHLVAVWLSGLRVGQRVSVLDCIEHLRRTGDRERIAALDPRAQGAAIARIGVEFGWLRAVGYGPNGGGEQSNSTRRAIYEVVRLPAVEAIAATRPPSARTSPGAAA